ncbi:3-keto-disaccharide hydrolase [Membranihabitans marinus]|uniref:3-keto-disaccharide hydrolase n=1 Tax=Membranihabitans marinus TaxID=1227546 RepID=UPI001F34CC3A|nr:DUF1080 domain-containing protein [Membranihabitans marinus]
MKQIGGLILGLCVVLSLQSCGSADSNAAKENESTEKTEISAGMSTDNTLTAEQKADGWKLLFDGKTTNGWHGFNRDDIGSDWTAMDGKLVFNPTKGEGTGGDIVTDEEYENFHLKIDWKISPCGNSGIMFNVVEGKEKPYHSGPEMQVLDNTCHKDAKIITHRAGDLYDLITGTPETVKPAGEWNTAEIMIKDGHLTFYLNGTQIVETQMFNDEWNQMIADSKFSQWPGFGTYKKGHICIQDHGDPVEFKNMMIKQL